MTRPEIIRADSIDLQEKNAPSAQDHTRQPNTGAPLGVGPPAPHHAEALREVAAEAAEQQFRSPRVSKEWSNGEAQQLQHYGDSELAAGVTASLTGANLQQQDALAVAQNGGLTGSTAEDAEMADAEGDDGMDEDMMDKISSSPSIDDGGYSLSQTWPQRSDSLSRTITPISSPSCSQACCESSSPFVETPEHYPLRPLREPVVPSIHVNNLHRRLLQGEYPDVLVGNQIEYEDVPFHALSPKKTVRFNIEGYGDYHDLSSFPQGPLGDDFEFRNETQGGEPRIEAQNLIEDDPLTLPYDASEDEEDDDYDLPYADNSRFVDSGWGGECLQKTEDIDFEFVYALHTFVATVEGQANATKGDTMVLLDDSNSYWWLVRVVKDSSIGYLPAEHIETPTERLARLNKHRNIDLTSTMLGDQEPKTKNSLKKAIRKRNAKTVTFTAPTYVEASDVDYSTDEEEGEGDYYGPNGQQEHNGDQQAQNLEEDEIIAIEPLKPRAEVREEISESIEPDTKEDTTNAGSDPERTSDEIFDGKLESSKSRNGTVRNTDSFFKDDSVETRKITLTPKLFRDDSSSSTRTSNDSKELKQRPSLDKLEKDSIADKKDKKNQKDKKEKDKKPGMLSGLFKRKDKKSKSQEDEVDEGFIGKQSTESRESPVPSKESDEITFPEESPPQEIQRQPSKLQKQPRSEMSPVRVKPGQGRDAKSLEPLQIQAPERPPPAESVQAPSMRLVRPEEASEGLTLQTRDLSPDHARTTLIPTSSKESKTGGAISKILRSASTSEPKPIKAKKAKSRVELDDFDTSEENSPVEEPGRAPSDQPLRPIPGSFPDSYIGTPTNERSNAIEPERLSESPVEVSPITPLQIHPPSLMVDTSSQEEPPSPVSSPSPELIDPDDAREKKGGSSTTSTSTATWSDAHLRTFFDDDADIKDLLVVVYDKSGVVPAGPDHPITGNMFKEENAKLADITNRLDGMLGDWLARKMRTQASR